MSARAVMTDYLPRWFALYDEATRACQDAAGTPFSLPAYLAMVSRVLLALYDLREAVSA